MKRSYSTVSRLLISMHVMVVLGTSVPLSLISKLTYYETMHSHFILKLQHTYQSYYHILHNIQCKPALFSMINNNVQYIQCRSKLPLLFEIKLKFFFSHMNRNKYSYQSVVCKTLNKSQLPTLT